jgi:hypothetical protein
MKKNLMGCCFWRHDVQYNDTRHNILTRNKVLIDVYVSK